MSLEEFYESQRKIHERIESNFAGKLFNNEWIDKITKLNKAFNYSSLDKLISNPIYKNFTENKSLNIIWDNFSKIDSLVNGLGKPLVDPLSRPLQKALQDIYKFKSYDFSDFFEKEEVIEKGSKIIQPKPIIITELNRVKNIITDIYEDNTKLLEVHHREFEKIIAELLESQGFDVELSKQTRDGGYDIIAMQYMKGLSPIKYLVECKRYAENRKIGVGLVRGFKEVIQTEQANKGIIVTTSYFTKDAEKKRKETPWLLDYKDKNEVIEWINDYYKLIRN